MIDLIKNYVIGILFLLLGCMSFYAYTLRNVVANNATTIQGQKDKIGGFVKDLESTNSLVQNFSDSFNQMKVDQAAREKEVQDAMDKVSQIAALHTTYSAQLLSETPKSSDLCKESNDLINTYLTKGVVK